MVRLTDRPDMTLDVYRGRKTTIQQHFQFHRELSIIVKYKRKVYVLEEKLSIYTVPIPFECFAYHFKFEQGN